MASLYVVNEAKPRVQSEQSSAIKLPWKVSRKPRLEALREGFIGALVALRNDAVPVILPHLVALHHAWPVRGDPGDEGLALRRGQRAPDQHPRQSFRRAIERSCCEVHVFVHA